MEAKYILSLSDSGSEEVLEVRQTVINIICLCEYFVNMFTCSLITLAEQISLSHSPTEQRIFLYFHSYN